MKQEEKTWGATIRIGNDRERFEKLLSQMIFEDKVDSNAYWHIMDIYDWGNFVVKRIMDEMMEWMNGAQYLEDALIIEPDVPFEDMNW